MALSSDDIKNNYASMQSGKIATSLNDKAEYYKKGAIIGGVAGFAGAMIFGGKFILWSFIGAVAGGYIGYKIAENNNSQPEFTNNASFNTNS